MKVKNIIMVIDFLCGSVPLQLLKRRDRPYQVSRDPLCWSPGDAAVSGGVGIGFQRNL